MAASLSHSQDPLRRPSSAGPTAASPEVDVEPDELPSPGRMATLSASVGSLSLLQLINAVGRDYGSAPPVEDPDDADEVLADSEAIAFSPKMLLERERELLLLSPSLRQQPSLPSQRPSSSHESRATSCTSPPLVRESKSSSNSNDENGDVDPLASSIHAIHRPWQPLSPVNQRNARASPLGQVKSSSSSKDRRHRPETESKQATATTRAEWSSDEAEGRGEGEPSEEEVEEDEADSDSETDDDCLNTRQGTSPLTASRLRELDQQLRQQTHSPDPSRPQKDQAPSPTAAAYPADDRAAPGAATVAAPDREQHPPAAAGPHAMSRAQRLSVLAEKLQEVFGHAEQEEVVAEFQAFLLRSVLLQGFLYLTTGHICFYAYLRAKEGQVLRSGSLYKRASKTRRHKQHWFVLRSDVLSWYPSAAEPYFPNGDVSLCYVIAVEPSRQNPKRFKVLTANRRLLFTADSQTSRDEWVKTLNKAVFQCQNEGDSVKISIPLETVLSVEKTSLDFVDALNIRVFDGESSSSGDTYPFCYLNNMQAAYDRVHTVLSDFKSRHPDWTPRSLAASHISTRGPDTGLASRRTSQTATPLAASRLTSSKLAEAQDEALPKPVRKASRRASVETITTTSFQPNNTTAPAKPIPIPSNSVDSISGSALLDDGHTYPPGTSGLTPPEALSETLGKTSAQWPIPDWLRGAPKLMGSVPRPSIPSLSWPVSSTRRITEVLSSPTQPDQALHGAFKAGEPASNKFEEDFRTLFLLPTTETLHYSANAYIYRGLPIYGRIYLTTTYVCFRSTNFISGTRMILPLRDVIAAQQSRAYRFGYSGMVLVVRGHEELFFELTDRDSRDTFRHLLEQQIDYARENAPTVRTPSALEEARRLEELQTPTALETSSSPPSEHGSVPAIMFQSTSSSFVDFKPKEQLHFVCLTIGSRGDVQPYIALCKGLIAEGHRCTIASHPEYRKWVESHGIGYSEVGGDPAELMRICVDNGMFTVSFLKEGLSKFRGWLDDLLQTSWQACQSADVLIESPSAMSGIHIAEALQIPYFRAFTMPWTKTRAYPHAFAVPENKLGGQYNYLSYSMFDSIFWRAISGQINRWRKECLHLSATSADRMEQGKVPFLYNLSPSLMPPPLDWPEWVHVTGYWFLDNPDPSGRKDWQPPASLVKFMESARQTGRKIVYIGFGSIVVPDPEGLTRTVNEAVAKANVCAVVSKGWSSRLATELHTEEEKVAFAQQQAREKEMMSEAIYTVDAIPHDWLFPRVDAACHHGGSGTTGASLKAGIPTIIKPFFGDQFFQADRMEALGVGTCLRKLTVDSLARALSLATTDIKQIKRAQLIGQEIRKEDGVATAIEMIYRDLEYAKTLVKRRRMQSKSETPPSESSHASQDHSRSLSRESFAHLSSSDEGRTSEHLADAMSEDSWDHLSHASDVISKSGGAASTPDDSDGAVPAASTTTSSPRRRSRSGSVLDRARSAGKRVASPFKHV